MSRKPELRASISGLPPEQAVVIRAQLERILSSPQFRGSRRCQNLLRHITQQTLAGETARLKERSLGIEVFERPPDYDTSQDPVVRATAAETRKKLAQYYQEPGREAEPRIELLPGSYVAEFHLNSNGAVAAVASVHPIRRAPASIAWSIAGAAVLVMLLTLFSPRWATPQLEQLWKPFVKAPGTVIISLGQPITYNLRSIQAQDAIQGIGGGAAGPDSGPDVIPKKDLVILPDRYTALGDVICLVHLTSKLEHYGKPYRIRGERSTTFADLRETPSILIGGFDNQWTLHVVGQLRFTFVKDDAHATDLVRDRQHPENTEWKLTGAWPYWDVSNDYAIVTRVLDTPLDRPVLIAAGITQYGTMAAGEFLTSPEYFSEAASGLPRGWETKNLQVVLRVPVVNRVPGHPQILARHVW